MPSPQSIHIGVQRPSSRAGASAMDLPPVPRGDNERMAIPLALPDLSLLRNIVDLADDVLAGRPVDF